MNTKLFDDWNVQLAKTYKPGMIKDGEWFSISQKINGTRATYFASHLISRTGHEFLGLDHIIEELCDINKYMGEAYAFDGELRLKEINRLTDNEAFRIGNGIATSQRDFTLKRNLKFVIFDIIPAKWWANDSCDIKYRERLKRMHSIPWSKYKYVEEIPVFYAGYDIGQIEVCSNFAYEYSMEGIMINRDSMYQFKRTSELLKYKKFNTIDLEVIGFQEGTGKYEGVLGALVCKMGSNTVYVGSGFTDEQRYEIWEMQEAFLHKLVEVKYKDITNNKETGLASLQFPVFVRFRDTIDKDISDA